MRPPTPLIKSSISRHDFPFVKRSAQCCSPETRFIFTLPDLVTSCSHRSFKCLVFPSPLLDAIAAAALESVQTRTYALSPRSVIIDPVMTASYSTSAVLTARVACVLDQCFTITLVNFLSGPVAQSTCTPTFISPCFLAHIAPRHSFHSFQTSGCLLQSLATLLCRTRHLRAHFLRSVLHIW